jgi:hypothetical protein
MKNDRNAELESSGGVGECPDPGVGVRLAEYVEQLSLFAIGKLDGRQDLKMRAVQQHLLECPSCQEAFQDLMSEEEERERELFLELLKHNKQVIFHPSQDT